MKAKVPCLIICATTPYIYHTFYHNLHPMHVLSWIIQLRHNQPKIIQFFTGIVTFSNKKHVSTFSWWVTTRTLYFRNSKKSLTFGKKLYVENIRFTLCNILIGRMVKHRNCGHEFGIVKDIS